MSEESIKSVSEMLKVTAENNHAFLMQVVEYINTLEKEVINLREQLEKFESLNE